MIGAAASVEAWEAARRLYGRHGEIVNIYGWPDRVWNVRLRQPDGSKTFRWMSKNGNGFEIGRCESLKPPGGWTLYGLSTLSRTGVVFVVEGEKDCHALADLGAACVTSGSVSSDAGADWSASGRARCDSLA